eukprot:TRINITY_DN5377_c1_g3_i1.p2 TRINITY_DN5377_c1_g3~~TRINITY_DN5377_c1_g3_i1.p2  ORF type:complete len:464 (+),score=191.44 TRINITY_DN5377_c1_g3_i1:70-1461(+)
MSFVTETPQLMLDFGAPRGVAPSSHSTSDSNMVSGEEADSGCEDDLLQLLQDLGGFDPAASRLDEEAASGYAQDEDEEEDEEDIRGAVDRMFSEPTCPPAQADPFAALTHSLQKTFPCPYPPTGAPVPAFFTPSHTDGAAACPTADAPLAKLNAKKQLLVVSGSPTCAHNHWDNVRTKKGNVYLRCRMCDSQWRAPLAEVVKCEAFVEAQACPHGDSCSKLHIYQKKQSLNHRVQLHGDGVLRRVMRCGLRLRQEKAEAAMAAPVTARVLPRSPTASASSGAVSLSPASTDSHGSAAAPTQTATVLLERGNGSAAIGMVVKGPRIVKVDDDCPASHSGLRPGMVIHRISGVTVAADATTDQIIADLRRVWGHQQRVSVTVKYAGAPPLPTGMSPHLFSAAEEPVPAAPVLPAMMMGRKAMAHPDYMAQCLNVLALQNMHLQQQLVMADAVQQGFPLGAPMTRY